MQFSTVLRTSVITTIKSGIGTGATLKFYTGSSPGVSIGVTGTLLSTLTAVVLGTPTSGAMTVAATADSSAAASGTAGYGRISGGTGTEVVDVTAAIGSGEANFGGTVSLGGTVTLTSGTITAGNA